MNDNYKELELVSSATEKSISSTNVLIHMIDSIKHMSDKLNAVVKD